MVGYSGRMSADVATWFLCAGERTASSARDTWATSAGAEGCPSTWGRRALDALCIMDVTTEYLIAGALRQLAACAGRRVSALRRAHSRKRGVVRVLFGVVDDTTKKAAVGTAAADEANTCGRSLHVNDTRSRAPVSSRESWAQALRPMLFLAVRRADWPIHKSLAAVWARRVEGGAAR